MHELFTVFIEHLDKTCSDKDNFVGFPAIRLNLNTRGVDSGVKLYDEFVAETLFAWVEEVVKPFNEVFEQLFNQLSLHLRWQLLVQTVFFYDYVEVKVKRLRNGGLDWPSHTRMQVIGLVRLLDTFHPEVELSESSFEQIWKGDISAK